MNCCWYVLCSSLQMPQILYFHQYNSEYLLWIFHPEWRIFPTSAQETENSIVYLQYEYNNPFIETSFTGHPFSLSSNLYLCKEPKEGLRRKRTFAKVLLKSSISTRRGYIDSFPPTSHQQSLVPHKILSWVLWYSTLFQSKDPTRITRAKN